MKPHIEHYAFLTRRQFFGRSAYGLGTAALATLLNRDTFSAELAPMPRFAELNFCAGFGAPQWRFRDRPEAKAMFAAPFVWTVASNDPGEEKLIAEMRAWLCQQRPDALIGHYWSAATTATDHRRWTPERCVPFRLLGEGALLADSWKGDAARRFIDLRQPEVRKKMVAHIVATTTASGLRAVSLDNVTQGYKTVQAVPVEQWDKAHRALVGELFAACRAAGLRLIVNAAAQPAQTWDKLLPIVDGLTWEMPLHPNTLADARRVEAELRAYRGALDAGKFIGLIPLVKAAGETERNETMCAAAAMLVREPGEPLAVSPRGFVPVKRDWFDWPARLGKPKAAYQRTGEIFRRDFERGTVTLDVGGRRAEARFE
jgi:hypothetical protein